MAMATNTVFGTTGGAEGPTVASAPPAEYLSPLTIHTPRPPVPSPRLPNATAFTDIFVTALSISLAGMLVTLFVTGRAGEIEAYEHDEEHL